MTCECAHISKGNTKLGGDTPNINLPPPETCKNMPCLKTGCYAMKAYRIYPNVREVWNENLWLYKFNPARYFDSVIEHIKGLKFPPLYFRWHSAGEIPDQAYFDGMVRVAEACPEIRFLVFTKKFELKVDKAPTNLSVIFSSWPTIKIPKKIRDKHPIAWMDDGTQEDRIKKESTRQQVPCHGHCGERCRLCWHVNENPVDIIFHKH